MVFGTLAFLISKLFEGILRTGSDLYKSLKHLAKRRRSNSTTTAPSLPDLLSTIISRNDSLTYSLEQHIKITSYINDEYVTICLSLNTHDYMELPEFAAISEKRSQKLASLEDALALNLARYTEILDEYSNDLWDAG
jgi:hypothetical protein